MNRPAPDIDFLSVDNVLHIHAAQIARFGGAGGVRDRGLLESALAQPQAGFGAVALHGDIWAMAAAYWFHLVRNHAFVDGNKRVGLVAALAFLELNGIELFCGDEELYDLTMALAVGQLSKDDAAHWLRHHTQAR